MDLKSGYKQTEAGVIPQDWRIESIEQIATVGRGRVISHREIAKSINGLYPVYSSQTSDNGVMGYIDTFEFEGDYITWTTDGANAGTVFQRSGRFNCTNVCGTIKLKSDDHYFVAKVLGTIAPKHVSRHLGNPKLMNDVVKRIRLPLPPTRTEQRAIAEALSDVDALLGALDRLIAKKRDLKQAAMQQLLTGQTRLFGFEGGWKEVEFGDVASIRNNKLLASATPRGTQSVELEFLGQGNGRLLMSADASGEVLKYSFKKGDVLFGRLRAYLRKYWYASFAGICSTEIWPLTARDHRLSNQFLYFLVQTDGFGNAAALSYGTHMPRSDWLVLKKLLIRLPSVAEQTAIATILSDIDAELEALEQRRAKTALLKQGMMQELLTGRTRLV